MSIRIQPRDDGIRPRQAMHERHCRTCGTRVTKYKNPCAETTLCYCCEDKLPWTYALIAGGGTLGEEARNRREPDEETINVVG